MTHDEKRVTKIQALLAMAANPAATEAERAAFSDKAAALMLEWGIADAVVNQRERTVREQIVKKTFLLNEVPASFSFEYAVLGAEVAGALGMRGLIGHGSGARRTAVVIGFESDVEHFTLLYASLITQAVAALATYARQLRGEYYLSATDRFNQRRSFIRGFGAEVGRRIVKLRGEKIKDAESKTPGTELAVIDRDEQVLRWLEDNMNVRAGRVRRYHGDGTDSGKAAGARADIGQTQVQTSDPRAIGGA